MGELEPSELVTFSQAMFMSLGSVHGWVHVMYAIIK